MTFGASELRGFFVGVAALNELTINVTATAHSDFQADGLMGLLNTHFTQDPNATSTLTATYTVDVQDMDNDLLLSGSQLTQGRVAALVDSGQASIHLLVQGSFLPPSIDPANYSVLGLNLGQFFNLGFTARTAVDISYHRADPLIGGFGQNALVTYGDVEMDLSPFFTQYVSPIISRVQQFLRPIEPVIDFLTQPVPVIGDILAELQSGDSSFRSKKPGLIDLVRLFNSGSGQGSGRIEAVLTVINLIDRILTLQLPTANELNTAKARLTTFSTNARGAVQQRLPNGSLRADPRRQSSIKASQFFRNFSGTGLAFPILEDPEQVIGLFLGNANVDLFRLNLHAAFGQSFGRFFPLLYGLGVNLGVDVTFSLMADVGYDTRGLSQFVTALNFNDFDQTTGELMLLGQTTSLGLQQPGAVAVTPDNRFLVIASTASNKLVVVEVPPSGPASFTLRQTFTDGLGGVEGLAGPAVVTVNQSGIYVYVVGRGDNAIAIFGRDPNTGQLTFAGRVQNGVGGVLGLGGVRALAISSNGRFLIAAGGEDNAVVVFDHADTGALTYAQRLRNGSGQVTGLRAPNSLAVGPDGNLFVGSSGDGAVVPGSIAWFTVDAQAPPPVVFPVNHEGMGSLTVQTAGGSDTASLANVDIPTTLATAAGDDSVTVLNTAPNALTTVSLGNGSDFFDLRGPGAGSAVTVNGEARFRYSFDFNNAGGFTDPGDRADVTSPTASFVLPAAGNHTVRGRIKDKDGGFTDYTAAVTVVPPVVVESVVINDGSA